jgi:hypothetical protein
MVVWTWPMLREVHAHASPTYGAIDWIRNHIDRTSSTIYVHEGMEPYAEELLSDYSLRHVTDTEAPTTWLTRDRSYFLKEGAGGAPGAQVFARPRRGLWNLARQRYFEVSVVPMEQVVDFRDGWYPEEGSGDTIWRWMGRRGVALLPRLRGPRATLTLQLYVPLDALRGAPTITIALNGAIVDRFAMSSKETTRTYQVPPRSDAPNELVIETDRVVNPAAEHLRPDARDLGVRLEELVWK